MLYTTIRKHCDICFIVIQTIVLALWIIYIWKIFQNPFLIKKKNRSVSKFGDVFFYMNIIHIKTGINYIHFSGTDQYQKYSYMVIW
jgi:hypothetical protein